MIGRNDLCHCGSGKKYKRCCGRATDDLVEMIVNEELDQILSDFFRKRIQDVQLERIMHKWIDRLQDSWEKSDIEEASSEFYLFIKNSESWQAYVNKKLEETNREGVKAVLSKWDKPLMLLAEIVDIGPEYIHVQALFDEKTYTLKRNDGMPTDVGTLLFGIVLPDSRRGEKAVAPVSSILFLARWSKQTTWSLYDLWKESASESVEQFIETHALDIYELFIKRSMASMNEVVEEVLEQDQLEALSKLEETLNELQQVADVREMMHKLSVAYFMNATDDLESIDDFIAGALLTGEAIGLITDEHLQSLVSQIVQDEKYESKYKEDLHSLYVEMMAGEDGPVAIREYEIGTDPRPTEKRLWETAMTTGGVVQPERKLDIAGSRAQLLAFEAFAAKTEEERRNLAGKAKKIDAQNPDVLLLQAEVESEQEKIVMCYEKAIRNASKVFEPGENPWQNIPNRPLMRAAFAYGVYLFSKGEYDEAASVFLDLLKMNRVDNQGARYEVVASLIHAERYKEAAEILVRYEKGSEHDATYLYLDWLLEHLGGQEENASEMLQKATRENRHVMHLKTFKVQPTSYPRYQKIKPESEEEARYIWYLLNGGERIIDL